MYSFKERVRYSEVNKQGKLSIPGIVNYMQDCSTFQSEELGIGIDFLMEHHKAWVLNSWQIDLLEDIDIGQEIKIGTWAYDAKGIYGYRNFVIRTPEDKPLVNANSLWVYLNTETGRPIKVTPEDVAPYGKEPRIEMEYLDRKIKIEGEGQEEQPFVVRKYHIDTNGHVNNSWYVQFAMEYIPDNHKIGEHKINRLRVEYKKSAMYGDEIHPVVYRNERHITVALNDMQGSTYAIVQLVAV
jgi:acyl-ACP thioesterase